MNREEENDDVVLQGSGVHERVWGSELSPGYEDRSVVWVEGWFPGVSCRGWKVLEGVAGGPKFV